MKKIAFISDLHCGHRAGLTPIGWQKEDHQKECFEYYKTMVRNIGKIDLLIVNGDAIDGRGDRSGGTEQNEMSMLEQCDMATKCIQLWNTKKIVMTYGTPYHVGKDEDYEGLIANRLGAEIESHAFIKVEDCVIDAKHKIGGSSVPHGRATGLGKEKLWNMYWEEIKCQPKANVFVRGHVHYHHYTGDLNYTAMTLPALQIASTKYGGRQCSGTVDWGMISAEIRDNRFTWTPHIVNIVNKTARLIEL